MGDAAETNRPQILLYPGTRMSAFDALIRGVLTMSTINIAILLGKKTCTRCHRLMSVLAYGQGVSLVRILQLRIQQCLVIALSRHKTVGIF